MDHKTLSVEQSTASESIAIYDELELSNLPLTPQIDTHPVYDDIAQLRMRLPFVPIVPFPRAAFLVQIANGVTADILIPDQAVLMRLAGQGIFTMTDKGAADGITSALQVNGIFAADIFVTPAAENEWIYVYGMRSVSIRNISGALAFYGARFIFRDEI